MKQRPKKQLCAAFIACCVLLGGQLACVSSAYAATASELSCIKNGQIKLAKNWDHHPSTRNMHKNLRCANGKKGMLYSNYGIHGPYFITNKKRETKTESKDNICSLAEDYCGFSSSGSGSLSKLVEVKSSSGKADRQISPHTFSRNDLLGLLSDKQNELTKTFETLDWMRSGQLARLDSLPQGEYYYLYSKIIGFNDAASEIRIAHDVVYQNGNHQVMVVTWDIATKELQKLIVLDPQTSLRAVSPDQRWLAVERDGSLMTYDADSGKSKKTLMPNIASLPNRKGYSRDVYSDVAFSSDSRYLTASTSETFWVGDVLDERVSTYLLNIFAVDSGKYLKRLAKPFSDYKKPRGSFSPDGARFQAYWQCQGCKGSGEGEYMEAGAWRPIIIPNMHKLYEGDYGLMPDFSGDSKFLLGSSLLFDLDSKKQVERFDSCFGGLGRPVIGGDLNVYLQNDKFEYQKIIGNRCVVVSESYFPPEVATLGGSIVFSKDLTLMASLHKDLNGLHIMDIVDSHYPNEKVVAQAVVKAEKAAADRIAKTQPKPAVQVLED